MLNRLRRIWSRTHLIPGLPVPHFLSPWTNNPHKIDPPGQTVPIKLVEDHLFRGIIGDHMHLGPNVSQPFCWTSKEKKMSTLCICIDLSLVYGAYSICMQWVPIEASAMDLGRPLIAPKCIFWQREQHCYNGFKVFMKLYLNFNEIFFLLFMFGCGYRFTCPPVRYFGMKIYYDFSKFLNCPCEIYFEANSRL